MKKLLAICAFVLAVGAVLAVAVETPDDPATRLGEAFVEGLRAQDLVALSQCWFPNHRVIELVESYDIELPTEEIEGVRSDESRKYAHGRNRNIIATMNGLFELFRERELDISKIQLVSVEMVHVREQVLPNANSVEMRIRVSDSIEMEFEVDDAVQIGGVWYFSDSPMDDLWWIEDGKRERIDLGTNKTVIYGTPPKETP